MVKDEDVFYPDEKIENADWPKRTDDTFEAHFGEKKLPKKEPEGETNAKHGD